MADATTVSDVLVQHLLDWGVDTIFGLPGDGINGFMEALRKAHDRLRFIHVRHEETAALAACAYAKFSGKLGVCFSTAAPGAIHLLNGIYDAKMDQAPLLAITGMSYHDVIGTHYLQDMNTDYLYQDATVFNQRLMGPAHIHTMANLAIRHAISLRGPAHLAIPIDFQAAEVGSDKRSKRNVPGHTTAEPDMPVRVPTRGLLEAAAKLFEGKHKIAILAGAGARGAGPELEQAAEKLGAPIVKAMLGKEAVPDDSAYVTGGIGAVGTRPSQEAFEQCDGLLIIGSSMPYVEFYPKPGQCAAVQIDADPTRIGLRHPVDAGLVGDAKATLQELLPLLPRNDDRTFLEQAQKATSEWWTLMEERGTRDDVPMKPQVVPWLLSQVLADDAIICGDSGTVTTWAARQIKLRRGQKFSSSGTLCSMAAGLSYAIGAQCAFPHRQVVAFTGDGSLSMMMGDFVTAVQHDLPIKIVVLKNNTLGLIKWEQMVFLGNSEYGVNLAPIDFVKVAEACGGRGVHIEDPKRCREQLEEGLNMPGPAIIECVVDPHEPPLPAKIKPRQAQHMWDALRRGEVNRKQIALTIGRDVVDEIDYAAAPSGVLGRVTEAVRDAAPDRG